MAIPNVPGMILPTLAVLADGHAHHVGQVAEMVADRLGLGDEDRNDLLDGGEPRYRNRVRWSIAYLRQAVHIETVRRGYVRITPTGKAFVAAPPAKIDHALLRSWRPTVQFGAGDEMAEGDVEVPQQSPDEQLQAAYHALRAQLASDILDRLTSAPPAFFERVVVDVLVAMGYGGSRKDAGRAVGRSGDDGIDGIIKEDRLGLDAIYLQAKRWQHPVSRPDIQAFVGSLEGQRARKGVFITTSRFTPEAREYVTRIEKRVVLIDGPELAALMAEHGVGVADVATYTVKRVDTDYFEDGVGSAG